METKSTTKTLKKGMLFYPKSAAAALNADHLEELIHSQIPGDDWKKMTMEDLDTTMRGSDPPEKLVITRFPEQDAANLNWILLLNPEPVTLVSVNPGSLLFPGTTWDCIRLIEGLYQERRVYVYYFSEVKNPIEEEICLYDGTSSQEG